MSHYEQWPYGKARKGGNVVVRDREDSLSDVILADRLARLEVVIESLKKDLDIHIQAQNGLFYKYGWPMVQTLIWLAIVLVVGKGAM